jgi:hypothetical protein
MESVEKSRNPGNVSHQIAKTYRPDGKNFMFILLDNSNFKWDSEVAKSGMYDTKQKESNYDPSNDYVSRTELKYILEKMMNRSSTPTSNVSAIRTNSFRNIGKFDKKFKLARMSRDKKSKKTELELSTEVSIKQNIGNEDIVVNILDKAENR